MAQVYVRRSKPFKVMLLAERNNKLKTPPGEVQKQAQDAIEAAMRDGNSEGEVNVSGVVYTWQEWADFENDMRLKELAEQYNERAPNPECQRIIDEIMVLIRDGIT